MKKLNLLTLFSGIGSPEAGALRVYDEINISEMIFRQIEFSKHINIKNTPYFKNI